MFGQNAPQPFGGQSGQLPASGMFGVGATNSGGPEPFSGGGGGAGFMQSQPQNMQSSNAMFQQGSFGGNNNQMNNNFNGSTNQFGFVDQQSSSSNFNQQFNQQVDERLMIHQRQNNRQNMHQMPLSSPGSPVRYGESIHNPNSRMGQDFIQKNDGLMQRGTRNHMMRNQIANNSRNPRSASAGVSSAVGSVVKSVGSGALTFSGMVLKTAGGFFGLNSSEEEQRKRQAVSGKNKGLPLTMGAGLSNSQNNSFKNNPFSSMGPPPAPGQVRSPPTKNPVRQDKANFNPLSSSVQQTPDSVGGGVYPYNQQFNSLFDRRSEEIAKVRPSTGRIIDFTKSKHYEVRSESPLVPSDLNNFKNDPFKSHLQSTPLDNALGIDQPVMSERASRPSIGAASSVAYSAFTNRTSRTERRKKLTLNDLDQAESDIHSGIPSSRYREEYDDRYSHVGSHLSFRQQEDARHEAIMDQFDRPSNLRGNSKYGEKESKWSRGRVSNAARGLYKALITRLAQDHRKNLSKVKKLVDGKYRGREHILFVKMCDQLHCQPSIIMKQHTGRGETESCLDPENVEMFYQSYTAKDLDIEFSEASGVRQGRERKGSGYYPTSGNREWEGDDNGPSRSLADGNADGSYNAVVTTVVHKAKEEDAVPEAKKVNIFDAIRNKDDRAAAPVIESEKSVFGGGSAFGAASIFQTNDIAPANNIAADNKKTLGNTPTFGGSEGNAVPSSGNNIFGGSSSGGASSTNNIFGGGGGPTFGAKAEEKPAAVPEKKEEPAATPASPKPKKAEAKEEGEKKEVLDCKSDPTLIWKANIEAVYAKKNPAKLKNKENLEQIYKKYEGKLPTLYAKICKTYDLPCTKGEGGKDGWIHYSMEDIPETAEMHEGAGAENNEEAPAASSGGSNLFGSGATTAAVTAPATTGSIFGAAPASNNMFGGGSGTGLFGSTTTGSSNNIFGATTTTTENKPTTGLFGQTTSGLFGNTATQQTTQPQTTGGLFATGFVTTEKKDDDEKAEEKKQKLASSPPKTHGLFGTELQGIKEEEKSEGGDKSEGGEKKKNIFDNLAEKKSQPQFGVDLFNTQFKGISNSDQKSEGSQGNLFNLQSSAKKSDAASIFSQENSFMSKSVFDNSGALSDVGQMGKSDGKRLSAGDIFGADSKLRQQQEEVDKAVGDDGESGDEGEGQRRTGKRQKTTKAIVNKDSKKKSVVGKNKGKNDPNVVSNPLGSSLFGEGKPGGGIFGGGGDKSNETENKTSLFGNPNGEKEGTKSIFGNDRPAFGGTALKDNPLFGGSSIFGGGNAGSSDNSINAPLFGNIGQSAADKAKAIENLYKKDVADREARGEPTAKRGGAASNNPFESFAMPNENVPASASGEGRSDLFGGGNDGKTFGQGGSSIFGAGGTNTTGGIFGSGNIFKKEDSKGDKKSGGGNIFGNL